MVDNEREAPRSSGLVDLVVDCCHSEVVLQGILVFRTQRKVKLVGRQELQEARQQKKGSPSGA